MRPGPLHPSFGSCERGVREVSALRIPKKTRLGDTKAFAFTVATNPFDDVVRKELDQMGTMEAAVWSENEVLLLAAEGEQRARASGARRLQHPVFLSAVVVVHVGVHAPRVQLPSFGAQQSQSCKAVAPPNFEMHFRTAACQQELSRLQEGASQQIHLVLEAYSWHHLHVAADTTTTGHGSTPKLHLRVRGTNAAQESWPHVHAHIEPSSGGLAFFSVFARAVPSARWLVLLGSPFSSHCTASTGLRVRPLNSTSGGLGHFFIETAPCIYV